MLEILQFIFSDFSHFCETFVLIWVILEGIADIVRATKSK